MFTIHIERIAILRKVLPKARPGNPPLIFSRERSLYVLTPRIQSSCLVIHPRSRAQHPAHASMHLPRLHFPESLRHPRTFLCAGLAVGMLVSARAQTAAPESASIKKK
jgi:hypothetical protein